MAKSPMRSRTVWANTLMLLIATLSLPQLAAVVPEHWLPYVLLASAVLNIVLRFSTDEPISINGGSRR